MQRASLIEAILLMQSLPTRATTAVNSLRPFKLLVLKLSFRYEAIVTFNVKSTGIGIRCEILLNDSLIDSSSSVVSQRNTINLLSDSMPFSILLVPIFSYCEHCLGFSKFYF